MPAYYHTGSNPPYARYAVRLDRVSAIRIKRGQTDTIDWFVNARGEAIVREDFDNKKNLHQIWRIGVGRELNRVIYEEKTEIPSFESVGISRDGKSLVIIFDALDAYYLMDLDSGKIDGPILERVGAEIDTVFRDKNRVVLGVRYSGFSPSYYFFDEDLNQRIKAIQARIPGSSVSLVSWSEDFRKLIFYVEGGWSAGTYLLFDESNPRPISVGAARPGIRPEQIANTTIEEYAARDGLKIPALITAMKPVYEAGNAPLIVMPHGGPESHDRFGFDWMAQYFAGRGYIVLQPQFRGSSGFGREFALAGRGEWGGKMQSDLDDGVQYMIDQGKADPNRICMVGSSYGGYAALAAGAFSPHLYRCVVSFAGVSDIYEMLRNERSDHGSDHWVVSYWEDQFGGGLVDKDLLRSISPVNHAASFEAPVLLLHGKGDTVVPINQSKKMFKALQKAGKDVTYKILKGEDHWLRQSETRLEALQAMAEFIDEHL